MQEVLTIFSSGRIRHWWGCDWEQDLVSGLVMHLLFPPQNFKHWLHSVGDVVLVVWGMTLQSQYFSEII